MNTRYPLHSAPTPIDPGLRPVESAIARLRREQRAAARARLWRRLSVATPTDPGLRPVESAIAYLRRARLRREQRAAARARLWRRLSVATVLAVVIAGVVFEVSL